MKMSPEEKAKKDAEMEAKGYVKDYVFYNGELVESWTDPRERPVSAPRLFDKDGREVRHFHVNRYLGK